VDPARLPLRDVHLPPQPSWWPPAPGWWWLVAAVLLLGLVWAGWQGWRRARRRRWLRWFETESAEGTLPQQLASMSGLLRRAARRHRAGTELLQGEAWLRFLDGRDGMEFSAGPGRLLLDGGFRPQLDAEAFAAARKLARERFIELMERGR